MTSHSNSARLAAYILQTRQRTFPPEIIGEARKCLMDWVGVCLAACNLPEAKAISATVRAWQTPGKALMFTGGTTAAPLAALVNGTLSHCLDYDDTHIPTAIHVSGPVWATVFALGAEQGCSEELMLKAYITGYEVSARLGDDGVGVRLNNSGWHATSTLGMLGAAAAACVVLELDEQQIRHAMGLAATQVGGLTASFGTMAKPFHPGKAAMDAIIAAQLAVNGMRAATELFDGQSGVVPTLLQDREMDYRVPSFDEGWEITRNSFKAYAACQLAHAAIDGALQVRDQIKGRQIEKIKAFVHPLALKIAGITDPKTPTEGKFSIGFCVALGLQGYAATTQDFTPERLADLQIRDLTRRVQLIVEDGIDRTATRLEFEMIDGERLTCDIKHAFGSIGHPLNLEDLNKKFSSIVGEVLGDRTASELMQILHRFEQAGSLTRLSALCARS
jgi:2-methylcitrate dehydratase PrpD